MVGAVQLPRRQGAALFHGGDEKRAEQQGCVSRSGASKREVQGNSAEMPCRAHQAPTHHLVPRLVSPGLALVLDAASIRPVCVHWRCVIFIVTALQFNATNRDTPGASGPIEFFIHRNVLAGCAVDWKCFVGIEAPNLTEAGVFPTSTVVVIVGAISVACPSRCLVVRPPPEGGAGTGVAKHGGASKDKACMAITGPAVELSRGTQAKLLRMEQELGCVWTEQQPLRGLRQWHSLVGLNGLDLVVALRVLAVLQQSLIHCNYLPGVVACRDAEMRMHRFGSLTLAGQGWAAWPRALPPPVAPSWRDSSGECVVHAHKGSRACARWTWCSCCRLPGSHSPVMKPPLVSTPSAPGSVRRWKPHLHVLCPVALCPVALSYCAALRGGNR